MNHPSPGQIVPCAGSPCRSFRGGHNTHVVQARLVGESPWGWRDAIVTDVDGLKASLDYVLEEGSPVVWHHRSWAGQVAAGDPVRLHERYAVLGTPAGWFSVVVTGGLGDVPTPADPAWWAAETSAGIVDLDSGIGIPTDHESCG